MNVEEVAVILKVTNNCNLSCGYCYYDHIMQKNPGQMDLGLIDKIFKKISLSGIKKVNFIIHGGEPTTKHADYFKSIIKLQKKNLLHVKFQNNIQTNGTLISEELLTLIKENDISVGISLDGTERIHDYYRKFKNGTGSYSTIVENLNLLLENGIKTSILSVCSDVTLINLSELYPLVKSFSNISMWDLIVPHPGGYGYILTPNNLAEIMISLFNQWFCDTRCSFEFRFLTSILCDMFSCRSEKICNLGENCITKKNDVFFDVHGNASTCDCGSSINLGNINDHSFEYFLRNNPIRKKYGLKEERRLDSCMFCEWYKICYGGCPAHVDNNMTSNYYCQDYKEIFGYIKYYLTNMNLINDNKINLSAIHRIPNPKLREKLAKSI